MNNSKDLGNSFEKLKQSMREDDKFDYAKKMSVEFLRYAIDESQFMTKDEKGYFAKVKQEDVTPEELFDRFI